MNQKKFAIGIDLGGTKLAAALIDFHGKIVKKTEILTKVRMGPSVIIQDMATLIQELKSQCQGLITGVGIGVAGQIDIKSGVVYFAPNLKWHNIDLQSQLSHRVELPVTVTNDVRAATWGEWLFGAGKNYHDIVCLFIGTGVGGGVVCGDQMLSGASNCAGELGHITIDLNGPKCTCGNRGCFEAHAGGWAIASKAQNELKQNPKASPKLMQLSQNTLELIDARLVIEAANEQDPLALKIVNKAIESIIAGGSSIVNAFNPQRLILGGGIIKGLSNKMEMIEKGIRAKALKTALAPLTIVKSELEDAAGIVGAGALAFQLDPGLKLDLPPKKPALPK